MLSRRSFAKALAILPLAPAAAVDAVAPEKETGPRILFNRPEQQGIPGATFFTPGDAANAWLGGRGLIVRGFAGDQDIRGVVFEVDTAAGWVGVIAHHFVGDEMRLSDCPRYWVTGEIVLEGKQRSMRPYPGVLVLPPETKWQEVQDVCTLVDGKWVSSTRPVTRCSARWNGKAYMRTTGSGVDENGRHFINVEVDASEIAKRIEDETKQLTSAIRAATTD